METGKCREGYEDTARACSSDDQTLSPRDANSLALAGESAAESEGEQTDPMIGRILAGRYRLLDKLGQGGMAVVYKGKHIRMNRITAIKMLNSDLSSNPDFVARFIREAEMVSRLNHPNVVAIYDFGEAEDGLIYLAMEFLEGQPLSAVIKQQAPLPLERVVNIVRQSAAALDAAHKLGLIHRGFKPENVIISKTGSRADWVKVVDFGAAKWVQIAPGYDPLTPRGLVLGTPEYMSPEQVTGKELDPRSDIFSLALVAYEMLAGAHPFEGSRPLRRMVNRLLEPPLPFGRVRPQLAVPPAVEQIIRKGLARNPDERYSTVVEFASEFGAAARGGTFYQRLSVETRPLAVAPGNTVSHTSIAGQAEITSPLDQGVQAEVEMTSPDYVSRTRRKAAVFTAAIGLVILVLAAATFFYKRGPGEPALTSDISQGEAAPVDAQEQPQRAEADAKTDKESGRAGATDRAASQPARPERKENKKSSINPVQKAEVAAAEQRSRDQTTEARATDDGKGSAGNNTKERTSEVRPSPISRDRMRMGMELLRAGSYAGAVAEFLAVEESQPSNQDVHYLMGLAYEKLGRPGDALAAYRRCKSGTYAGVASQHVRRLSKKLIKPMD